MVNDLFDLSLWIGIVLFIYINLGILYQFFEKLGLFCFNVILLVISNIIMLNKLKAFEIYLNILGIIFYQHHSL